MLLSILLVCLGSKEFSENSLMRNVNQNLINALIQIIFDFMPNYKVIFISISNSGNTSSALGINGLTYLTLMLLVANLAYTK